MSSQIPTNILRCGDSWELIKEYPDKFFDALITDPLYDREFDLDLVKSKVKGNIIVFCSPENQPFKADEYQFWNKPISTKNFGNKCGRYTEMILIIRQGNTFNKLHFSQMSGRHVDGLIYPPVHPYEKPVSLIDRLLRIYTKVGDTVLDMFSGIGTGYVACQNSYRRCIGIEVEKKWHSMAEQRAYVYHHDDARFHADYVPK